MRKHGVMAIITVLALTVMTVMPSLNVYASGITEDTTSSVVASSLSATAEKPKAALVPLTIRSEQYPREVFLQLQLRRELSVFRFDRDAQLTVTAEQPVSQLYLQFDKPCKWTVTLPDGTALQGGENDFMHEYMALGQSVTSFTVDVKEDTWFTGLFAFTDGETPSWVQKWEPPCDRADLMLMPTHADDEHLWFGGAMPYYAGELGYKVQVVYMTHHFNWTIRCHEALNGLWTVGVRHYPIITDKFKDTFKAKDSMADAERCYPHDEVLEFQVEMLRRFAPRVIIAHDINGEYGHGAHKLNAATLLEALEIYEDPSVFPESAEKYGICKVQKCYLHLWKENKITVKWSEKKLAHFDGKSAYQMAVEGYKCHASQQAYNYRVWEGGALSCCNFGLAYTTVGYDTPDLNDMFEHVDWSERALPSDENNVSSGQSDEVISPTDTVVSGSDSTVTLFGRRFSKRDVCFVLVAAAAVVLLIISLIIVICLKKREQMQKARLDTE